MRKQKQLSVTTCVGVDTRHAFDLKCKWFVGIYAYIHFFFTFDTKRRGLIRKAHFSLHVFCRMFWTATIFFSSSIIFFNAKHHKGSKIWNWLTLKHLMHEKPSKFKCLIWVISNNGCYIMMTGILETANFCKF